MYTKDGQQLIAVMFSYINHKTYVPSLIGMNYSYNEKFSIYRQMLYRTILRAKELDCGRVDFGFSATFEKKKMGSVVVPKLVYIQAKDNFSMEMMELAHKS